MEESLKVIPVKAGIQSLGYTSWIPAFAGMTDIPLLNRSLWEEIKAFGVAS